MVIIKSTSDITVQLHLVAFVLKINDFTKDCRMIDIINMSTTDSVRICYKSCKHLHAVQCICYRLNKYQLWIGLKLRVLAKDVSQQWHISIDPSTSRAECRQGRLLHVLKSLERQQLEAILFAIRIFT